MSGLKRGMVHELPLGEEIAQARIGAVSTKSVDGRSVKSKRTVVSGAKSVVRSRTGSAKSKHSSKGGAGSRSGSTTRSTKSNKSTKKVAMTPQEREEMELEKDTKKILKLAKNQQKEIDQELGLAKSMKKISYLSEDKPSTSRAAAVVEGEQGVVLSSQKAHKLMKDMMQKGGQEGSMGGHFVDDDGEEFEVEEEYEEEEEGDEDEDESGEEAEYYEDFEDDEDEEEVEKTRKLWQETEEGLQAEEITEEEEKIMKTFRKLKGVKSGPTQPVYGPQPTVYEKYIEALHAKRTQIKDVITEENSKVPSTKLDKNVYSLYKGVGAVLSQYRTGELPKAFFVWPLLADWEQILFVMQPERWTAAALYQAVRRMSGRAHHKQLQRFVNLYVLPRVRDDIYEFKRLNFYLFSALCRLAKQKTEIFFKGFVIPLCAEGNCNVREAAIIATIFKKAHMNKIACCVSMMKIAELPPSAANSVFLRTFFSMRMELPYKVVDASVAYFNSFNDDKGRMTLLWHQTFLTFVSLYKNGLAPEQKDALRKLAERHYHPKISPVIMRELKLSDEKKGRFEPRAFFTQDTHEDWKDKEQEDFMKKATDDKLFSYWSQNVAAKSAIQAVDQEEIGDDEIEKILAKTKVSGSSAATATSSSQQMDVDA